MPSQARVLGSLVRRSSRPVESGAISSTIIVVSPQEPDSALESFAQGLLRSGWESFSFERPTGGFVVSEPRRPRAFCKGEFFLNVWARPRKGARQLSARDSGFGAPAPLQPGYARCASPSARSPNAADAPDPAASCARGCIDTGGGITGRGADHWENSTRVQTTRSAPELVAHYTVQLLHGGWTPMSQASGRRLSTQTLRFRDRTGQDWQGVLLAVSLPGTDQYELVFRAMQPSSRGGADRPSVAPDTIVR